MPLKSISKKVSAGSPVDPKKRLSCKDDLLTFHDCPSGNNCRLERSLCGWCGDEYTPAAAQPEVNDAIKVEKPEGSEEKASNVALEEKVSSEKSNATSRPAENKKRANVIDDPAHMARSDFKLEESSRLNFQGKAFDIEKPNSVAHMDKAKDKVVTHGGDVSSQDHPLQDESEEHGQHGGPPLKPEEHGQDGGPPLEPEECDHEGRGPLENKRSMDEFKYMTMTSSVFIDQDHGGRPPRELEELSQDGQSAPRLNDTYMACTLAYDKISTYEACMEAYDDNAALCA